jgi:thiosulfate dehydrogenase [quinone] large subunit
MDSVITRRHELVQEPRFVKWLLNDVHASWLWLFARLWLGYRWIDAAMLKVSAPAWAETGDAVKNFWENAIQSSQQDNPQAYFAWYRGLLQWLLDNDAYRWFGALIAYGELLVGVALVLGAFTGIAAFLGALMNWNFMLAGSASSDPMLLVVAIGIILAWKIAGYTGLDYFLLPWIGTPWHGAKVEAQAAAS